MSHKVPYDKPCDVTCETPCDVQYYDTGVSNKVASKVLGIVSHQVSNNTFVGITLNPSIYVHISSIGMYICMCICG